MTMRGVLRPWGDGAANDQSSKPSSFFGIIDPGASSLRLLVAEVSAGRATVWGWAECPGWAAPGSGVPLRGPGDRQRLLANCGEGLARAEAMARDRADRWFPADHVVVGLPASQLRGRAWSVVQQRPQPEHPVEERELKAVLGRALRLATNRLRSLVPEPDSPGWHELQVADDKNTGWLLVDAAVVALTVDGQRVTDPVGFRGRELGATVFAALTSESVVDTWRNVAERLEFTTLTLTVAPLALVCSQSELQGLLLDVGGETTDLTLWQAGRPVTLGSLPTGGAALTRSLIRAWDLSTGQAERLKHAYANGSLTDDDSAKVLGVMSPVLQHWLAGIEGALAEVNEDRPLPPQLYLGGGRECPARDGGCPSSIGAQRKPVFCAIPQDRTTAAHRRDRRDQPHEPGPKPGRCLGLGLGGVDSPANRANRPSRPNTWRAL